MEWAGNSGGKIRENTCAFNNVSSVALKVQEFLSQRMYFLPLFISYFFLLPY